MLCSPRPNGGPGQLSTCSGVVGDEPYPKCQVDGFDVSRAEKRYTEESAETGFALATTFHCRLVGAGEAGPLPVVRGPRLSTVR